MEEFNPFVPYLMDLADDIGKDECAKLIQLSAALPYPSIPKRVRNELMKDKNAYDLFMVLKEAGHLSKYKDDSLYDLLTKAKLLELAEQVKLRFKIGFNIEYSYVKLKEEVQLKFQNANKAHALALQTAPQHQQQQQHQNQQTQRGEAKDKVQIQTPAAQEDGPAGLIVNSKWSDDVNRLQVINKIVASELTHAGLSIYITALGVSDEDFVHDDTGVKIIYADKSQIDQLINKTPTLDWITSHTSNYPYLQKLKGILDVVVGHITMEEDGRLAAIGLHIKKDIAPESLMVFFIHDIPEHLGNNDYERQILDFAKAADVVFSVGPYVYHHFITKFGGIPEHQRPEHVCYYPPPIKPFTDMTPSPQIGKRQILTICNVQTEDDFPQYDVIAVAIGKVIKKFTDTFEKILPVWNLYGVNTAIGENFKRYLENKAASGDLQINIAKSFCVNDMETWMQQSVLLVAPEKQNPFNFAAYFAIQAGFPVLVPSCSGIAHFLTSLFPDDDYHFHCTVDTTVTSENTEADSEEWMKCILKKLIKDKINTAFTIASNLRRDLDTHAQLKQSQDDLVRLCAVRYASRESDNVEVPMDIDCEVDGNMEDVHTVAPEDHMNIDPVPVLPNQLTYTPGQSGNTPGETPASLSSPSWKSRRGVWSEKLTNLMALPDDQCRQVGNIRLCETDDEYSIATGCEGTKVLLGIDLSSGQEVAVKRIFKSDKTSPFIHKELEIVNNPSLVSDNIVKYHDVVEHSEYVYIIMELCEKTLGTYIGELKTDKTNLDEKSKSLVLALFRGLRTLHNCDPRIIHRDLKPENILIDCNGVAKLADFGISRSIAHNQSTFLTGAQGTMCWQAREVLLPKFGDEEEDEEDDEQDLGFETDKRKQSAIECSPRTDIQVAGMIAAYILSGGFHPFGDMKVFFKLVNNICKGLLKNMKYVKDEIACHMLTWMLQKERQHRPSINQVLRHPYFWDSARCSAFLYAVAGEMETVDSDNAVRKKLLEETDKIDCHDWIAVLRSNPSSDVFLQYPELFLCTYKVILDSQRKSDNHVNADPALNWTIRDSLNPYFDEDVV